MIDLKRFLPFIIGVLLFLGLFIGGISYLTSTHSLKVTYADTKEVTITQDKEGKTETVATVHKSGDSVRLGNDTDYTLMYKGADGFADGTMPVNQNASEVTVTPDYSVAKNLELMNAALPKAHALIAARYPNVDSLFTVESGSITQRGKWYLVKLIHKGDYTYTSDDLKVLLENVDGAWQLRTKPDIIFTTTAYPLLPVNILSWAAEL
jgi:hypothetical protein